MSDSDRKPTVRAGHTVSPGRTGAPPRVTTGPQGGPPPAGAASLWEPGAVGAPSLDEGQIEDLVTEEADGDADTRDWEPGASTGPVDGRPSGRTGPVVRSDRRRAPPHPAVDEAASVPVSIPVPSLPKGGVTNPPVPPAPRSVRVIIAHAGPADSDELCWVARGESGVTINVSDRDGRERRVAAFIGFLPTKVERSSVGGIVVTGIVRWHGMPQEKEGRWGRKLAFNNKERLRQLQEALEYALAFPPNLCPGMAVQFVGAPLTDPFRIQAAGYMFHGGAVGTPAVKVRFNTVMAEHVAREAMDFYRENSIFWPINFLRWERHPHTRELTVGFDAEAWQRYWRGRDIVKTGAVMPPWYQGISQEDMHAFLPAAAWKAAQTMTSFCRVAWAGDAGIEAAFRREGMLPVGPTRFGTVLEDIE